MRYPLYVSKPIDLDPFASSRGIKDYPNSSPGSDVSGQVLGLRAKCIAILSTLPADTREWYDRLSLESVGLRYYSGQRDTRQSWKTVVSPVHGQHQENIYKCEGRDVAVTMASP